jgi:anti-sigma factor RsiW
MSVCDDIRGRLNLYLDNELQGEERAQLELHIRDCESCRTLAAAEQRFLNAVREAQPLFIASPELQSRVRSVLETSSDESGNASQRWSPKRAKLAALVAATLLLLLLPVLIWRLRNSEPRSPGVSNFALMAADTHLRHMRGQLPLEMTATAPEHVSQWFANKTRFNVKLPNYQESAGHEKPYILEGARLVAYKNDYAAYVAYEMKDRPISLVITADSVAELAGGEEIKAKGLTFHYNAIWGLKVLTWSDRGLIYALVSDLEERGQESCIVCHQGIKDQDFIAPLKPR